MEAGSAGEAIAKEKGWQTNPVTAQADTLMEVSAGTSDAAIIDPAHGGGYDRGRHQLSRSHL